MTEHITPTAHELLIAAPFVDLKEDGEPTPELETEILHLQKASELLTRPTITIEAGLAIDQKFLATAIIMGEPTMPERIFGGKEWAAHLEARLFARQYGDQPLSTDFIMALHQRYLDRISPGKVSAFIDGDGGRGGQFINGRHAPITCTEEQIVIINNNPLLRFGIDGTSSLPNTGYIYYADLTAEERRGYLDEICSWYNDEYKRGANPYATAAIMQRCIISLHPLIGSVTGRLSRTLMNWSLENAGESPSIVDDVDGDLFLSEDDWTAQVRYGSRRYAELRHKAEAGETNLVVLFDLECERLRYEKFLVISDDIPPPLVGDDWHDHSRYEKFLVRLREMP